MNTATTVEEHRFRGEPAITLRAGELAATFVPNVGMTGVSLRYRGREHLALPGGLDALRAGQTAGLPLLAPWGNRLASRRYRAAGVSVDLRGLRLGTDDNGLPIHGLLVGKPGWRVDGQLVRGGTAQLRASIDVDARAFPFPHRIELSITARDGALAIDTTIVPTGRRRVPGRVRLAPLPEGSRHATKPLAVAPPRAHALGSSTSAVSPPARRKPSRERHHRSGGGPSTICTNSDAGTNSHTRAKTEPRSHCAAGAATRSRRSGCRRAERSRALEPMTAPTNALERGTTPLVAPGDTFTARFELRLTAPGSSA